jgi:hypothetical protein
LLETKSSTAKKKKKAAFDLGFVAVTDGKPEGPLPMPEHLLLEPVVSTDRAGGTSALASNPWAPIVAVAGQKQALLYHTETLELLGVLPYDGGFIESLTFSRNGQLLIAGGGRGGKAGGMVAWDVKTGRQRIALGKEYDTVLAADMMADLTTVALGGPGKRVKMFELPTGDPLYNIKKHSDWVMAVSFSPDTVLLATGDRNGGLHVWESFTGNLFYTLNGHGDDITQLSWRFRQRGRHRAPLGNDQWQTGQELDRAQRRHALGAIQSQRRTRHCRPRQTGQNLGSERQAKTGDQELQKHPSRGRVLP